MNNINFAFIGLLAILLSFLVLSYCLIAVTIPQQIVKLQNNETCKGIFGPLVNSPIYMNVISLLYLVMLFPILPVSAGLERLSMEFYGATLVTTTIFLIVFFSSSAITASKLHSTTLDKIITFFAPFYALWIAFRNAGINDYKKPLALIFALLQAIITILAIFVVCLSIGKVLVWTLGRSAF